MASHNSILETSMETISTYETHTTALIQEKASTTSTAQILCPSIFRARGYFPNLLDWTGSASSSSSLLDAPSSHENDFDDDDNSSLDFVPWDERRHRALIRRRQHAAAITPCASSTCTACRQAPPRFVSATPRRSLPSRRVTPPRWWESSPTQGLADQLGDWVETRLMRACSDVVVTDPSLYARPKNDRPRPSSNTGSTRRPEARFWNGLEGDDGDDDENEGFEVAVDDASTLPYDEKREDPRYASF